MIIVMSRAMFVVLAVLVLVLSLLAVADSGSNFYTEGSANADNGLVLTNTKKHTYGQAFYKEPWLSKNSKGTAVSFSVTFFFAIAPEHKHSGGHGMAFVISATKGIPGAFSDQYLGIFNDTNNGKSSNHIIAIELDTHKDDEFHDINDNHVGIDINGLTSVMSAPAGYYDEDGNFTGLSLTSGKLLRLSITYSHQEKQLNVTLCPPDMNVPSRPLLSRRQDLSPYMLENMYFGFTASTGSTRAVYYMWSWHVYEGVFNPVLEFAGFPVFPNPFNKRNTQRILVISLTLSVSVLLVSLILVFYLCIRHKKALEVIEEWEIQYGPHRFAYKDLFKATKGFNDKQILGKGGFGKVYKGILPVSDAEIAVKRISHQSKQGMQEFVAEIATIGRLRHPNLVRLLGYCRRNNELFLVYDYMPNGSLDGFLYRKFDEKLTWSQRFKIIRDVASALFFLHHHWAQVVIHRDIKPANVLIDHDMNARLGDFGLAKLHDHGFDPQTTKNVKGTYGYIAPEYVTKGKATTSTDIFAFGRFMLEVTCGRRPLEPRASPEKYVLADWILDRWENGDILETIDEKLREEDKREQIEMVLKLGMLCSHQDAAFRPPMTTVTQILNGFSRLPDDLLSIFKARVDVNEKIVCLVNPEKSSANVAFSEPFTSRGR